jgi:hypothetical protein
MQWYRLGTIWPDRNHADWLANQLCHAVDVPPGGSRQLTHRAATCDVVLPPRQRFVDWFALFQNVSITGEVI